MIRVACFNELYQNFRQFSGREAGNRYGNSQKIFGSSYEEKYMDICCEPRV